MSAETRYFRVGLFVLAGAAVIVATAVVVGGQNLFADKVIYETYFDESVQGLEVGSPVKRRGVKFGTVRRIGLVEDYYALTEKQRFEYGELVLVRIEAVVGETGGPRAGVDPAQRRERLRNLVEQGLRLQLTQSAITGVAFIEASILDPDRYPPMQVPWQPEHLYVPSAPSTIAQITSAAERFIRRLENADIEKVLGDLDALMVSVRRIADGIDAEALQGEVVAALADLRRTSRAVRRELEGVELAELGEGVRAALDETRATVALTRRSIEGGRYDLEAALENLRVTSENLRELSDTLKGQPSLLLRGAAPQPLEPGERDGDE